MPNVKCSVDSCQYWCPGGNCSADSISINKLPSAGIEVADEPGSVPEKERSAEERRQATDDDLRGTCCGTMRRRREQLRCSGRGRQSRPDTR